MPRRKEIPNTSTPASPPVKTDDIVRKALNVRKPAGGWPWNNKQKKPKPDAKKPPGLGKASGAASLNPPLGQQAGEEEGMSKRRQNLAGKIGAFIRQYARKKSPNDPNDRRYDRKVEKTVRHMKPEELDRLMRDETSD